MKNLYKLLPNEDLIGFVGRLHYLGPFRSFEDTRKYLGLTTRLLEPGRITYKDEEKLAQILGKPIGDIAQEHTSRNLLNYCMTSEEISKFEKPNNDLKMPVITFFDAKSIDKQPWRWCPVCVKEDLNTFGCAYYHRNHQLPGVHTCYKHCSTLNSECMQCGFKVHTLKNSAVPPQDNRCPCCGSDEFEGKVNLSNKMEAIQANMIAMASGELEESFVIITERLRKHIGLDEDDLYLRTGMMYVRQFYRKILEYFGFSDLSEYFSSAVMNNGKLKSKTLCNSRLYDSRTNHLPAHPLVYAMVLVYLEEFERDIPIAA